MEEKITPSDLGRRGGQKTYNLHGSEHYREMQRKGVENRRKRKLQAQIGVLTSGSK